MITHGLFLKKFLLVWMFGHICGSHLLLAQNSTSKVEDAIQRWKASCSQTWSYDAELDVKINSYSRNLEKSILVGSHHVRQRHLGVQWRVDFHKTQMFFSNGKELIWVGNDKKIKAVAYNGKEVKLFISGGDEVKPPFRQVYDPPTTFETSKLLASNLFELYKQQLYGMPLSEELHLRGLNGEILSENENHIRIHFSRGESGKEPLGSEVIIELSKTNGWLPTKILRGEGILNLESASQYSETTCIYQRLPGGLFFPESAKHSLFNKEYRGTIEVPASTTEYTVITADCNVEIEEEVFEVAFPPSATDGN